MRFKSNALHCSECGNSSAQGTHLHVLGDLSGTRKRYLAGGERALYCAGSRQDHMQVHAYEHSNVFWWDLSTSVFIMRQKRLISMKARVDSAVSLTRCNFQEKYRRKHDYAAQASVTPMSG